MNLKKYISILLVFFAFTAFAMERDLQNIYINRDDVFIIQKSVSIISRRARIDLSSFTPFDSSEFKDLCTLRTSTNVPTTAQEKVIPREFVDILYGRAVDGSEQSKIFLFAELTRNKVTKKKINNISDENKKAFFENFQTMIYFIDIYADFDKIYWDKGYRDLFRHEMSKRKPFNNLIKTYQRTLENHSISYKYRQPKRKRRQ